MSKNRIGLPGGNPFGVSFDAEIDPALKLSPKELVARMEQGFSVTGPSRKPVKKKTPVKGGIKIPANVVVPSPEQMDAMRKTPSKPVKRRRLPEPMKPRMRTSDILNVRREEDLFTVEPVNMDELARRAALSKIINRRIPKALQARFLTNLKKNQEAIAEFLVVDVASFDLAVPTGLEIASEYLNDSTDAAPSVELGRVKNMVSYITEIKTLLFLCELCGLSKAHTNMLVQNMVNPETSKAQPDTVQLLTKLFQANRAAAPQPTKPTRREMREQKEAARRVQALTHALRSR